MADGGGGLQDDELYLPRSQYSSGIITNDVELLLVQGKLLNVGRIR